MLSYMHGQENFAFLAKIKDKASCSNKKGNTISMATPHMITGNQIVIFIKKLSFFVSRVNEKCLNQFHVGLVIFVPQSPVFWLYHRAKRAR